MRADTFVWACGWLGLFLVLEFAGLLYGPTGMWRPGLVPWTTLSEYVWNIEALPAGGLMTAGVLIFFSGLTAHFVAHWKP